MNQDALRALLELFPQIFPSPDALRTWLTTSDVPDGERIVNNLPNTSVASAQYFFAAADILRRWGLLGVSEFWDPLAVAAPKYLKEQVVELRGRFGVPPSHAGTSQQTAPPTRPATQAITVLLVSASPESHVRLRVDKEFKSIIQRVRSTELRDRLSFAQLQAASFDELRSALLQYKPHILHISSHADSTGALQFEAGPDGSGLVTKPKLLKLLRALRDNLRLVVVNACDSQVVARDIPPTIAVAIGMDDKVQDRDAIEFAVAFYEAIGYGRTVESAFEVATLSLDEDVQQLFPPPDNDPDKKRQMVLLAP